MTAVRLLFASVVFLSGFPAPKIGVAAPSQQSDFDPLQRYGTEILFEVRRNGSPIGHHRIQFGETTNNDVMVLVKLDLEVTFLGFTAYRYVYRSEAFWKQGQLRKLTATQDEDGRKTLVRASVMNGETVIEGPKGRIRVGAALYPTNHWNVGVLGQQSVINTLDGTAANIIIRNQGREPIKAHGRTIEATKYRYSGDVDTTVWYDDAGRWVGMRFIAKGGSVIDYECVQCGLSMPPATPK